MAEYQASLKALNPDGSTASEVSIADEVVTVVGAGESSIVFESEYDGAHSFQAIAPDLTVGAAAGSNSDPKYLASVMGNIIGDALTKTKPILAGLIGKLSITGSRATTYSVSAIRGEVGDGVTDADGAFVAVLGGDSALTTARAAYSVDNENTTPGSGFDYGLDLAGSGTHDGYPAVAYAVADIRFSDGTEQSTAGGSFNGGTITDPLVIDPDDGDDGLVLQDELGDVFRVEVDGTTHVGGVGGWHTELDGGRIKIMDPDDNLRVRIDPGYMVQLYDTTNALLLQVDTDNKTLIFSPGGTPAFAVYDDGSVHIKTGTSIVADL